MGDFRATIPGWLDALKREAEAHAQAVAYPHDAICSVPVRHLSLIDVERLREMGSPFICGRFPSRVEMLLPNVRREAHNFLAFLHVNQSRSRWVNAYRRIRYGFISADALYLGIARYLQDTFLDEVGSTAKRGRVEINYWASVIEYVDLIASEYGWTDEYILAMPYRRLIQVVRRIRKRKDPKFFVSSSADRVSARHLEAINNAARN